MGKVDTIEQLKAIRRVLELLDGYIKENTEPDLLLAFDGGVMTWRELRYHIQVALEFDVLDFG